MNRFEKCVLSLACAAGVSSPAFAQELLYREVWPKDSIAASTGERLINEGWRQQQHDNPLEGPTSNEGQIFFNPGNANAETGSPNEPDPTATSDPQGAVPPTLTGRATWTPGARAGVFTYTTEFLLPVSALLANGRICFETRMNGTSTGPTDPPNGAFPQNDQHRVAFRVDTGGPDPIWYVSDQISYHHLGGSTWQKHTFDIPGSTWTLFDVQNCNGTVPPGDECLPRISGFGTADPPTTGLDLPADGLITAFGVWMSKNQQGTVRYDNYEIFGQPFLGLDGDRPHPGWNRVSAEITLTPNQPTYWSAFSGLGTQGGLNPITVPPFVSLDPDPTGFLPGRPCPDGADERCIRGYIVAWAVDSNNQETSLNQLSGSGTIVNYGDSTAWEYSAWTHQTVGAVTPDGVLNLDGNEYSPGFDLLLMDFYRDGSSPFGRISEVFGDLTLHPLDVDAQQGSTPVTTKAVLDLWNENEVKFDGLERCITCWDQTLFRDYAGFGVPNNLVNLQTDKGKARIDGRAGDGVCDIFDETEGPCGTLSSDTCGQDAALTGLVAHFIEFQGITLNGVDIDQAAFGKNLTGMGTQNATVQYTPLAPPPTANAPERGRRWGRDRLEASGRTVPLAAAAGSPVQDRASGTEKGSLLFISKVELRWNANNELIQDTFVTLINDSSEVARIQMEFINGDPPLD